MPNLSPKRKSYSGSLTSRIGRFSLTSIFFLILTAGIAIAWAFEKSAVRSLENHLSAYIDVLISATILDEHGEIAVSESIDLLNKIPRYWQVTSGKEYLRRSSSLNSWIPITEWEPSATRNFVFTDSDNTGIRVVQKTLVFPGNKYVSYFFGMQEEIADEFIAHERKGFVKVLSVVLLGLGAVLFLLSYILTRFTISPLSDVKTGLSRIRTGKSNQLEGNFPTEIIPLVQEVNRLLSYSSNVVKRHRTFASNLAHSLKTHLSVLLYEANRETERNPAAGEEHSLADNVLEKSKIMQSIIDRSLARAKAAGSGTVIGARTEVHTVISKITLNFGKLYHRETEIICSKDIFFHGDEDDLYEMLGNIIENACKYSRSKVKVSAGRNSADTSETTSLHIRVEDDGTGIPESERKNVLERGTRLDETVAGTGIGMSIAVDIIRLYGGKIILGDSELGGLQVDIGLPLGK